MNKKEYIGIDQECESEGESWGYLFEKTDQSEKAIKKFIELFSKIDGYLDGWELLEKVSDNDITYANKWSNNSYMNRLKIYKEPPEGWEEWIKKIKNYKYYNDFNNEFYKGPSWTRFRYDQ